MTVERKWVLRDEKRRHYWKTRADDILFYGFGPMNMKKLKVCSCCGKAVNAKLDYCTGCGTKLPENSLFSFYQQMHPYCPVCGTVAPDQARYCPHCSAELVNTAAESEVAHSG